jgi:hypothetical protein
MKKIVVGITIRPKNNKNLKSKKKMWLELNLGPTFFFSHFFFLHRFPLHITILFALFSSSRFSILFALFASPLCIALVFSLPC